MCFDKTNVALLGVVLELRAIECSRIPLKHLSLVSRSLQRVQEEREKEVKGRGNLRWIIDGSSARLNGKGNMAVSLVGDVFLFLGGLVAVAAAVGVAVAVVLSAAATVALLLPLPSFFLISVT